MTPAPPHSRDEEDPTAEEMLLGDICDILAERDMPLYPDAAADVGVCYTDFLTGAHSHKFATDPKTGKNYVYTPRRNRQCSIGYHSECSDPEGERCGCPCHPIARAVAKAFASARREAAREERQRLVAWIREHATDVMLFAGTPRAIDLLTWILSLPDPPEDVKP